MRKVFVTLCPAEELAFLPGGIHTDIFGAPLYEHAFKKIENAVKVLKLEVELVRASGAGLPNTVNEINAGFNDIVIFASPFVFLAKGTDVEGAVNYIFKTDLGYSTVGTERSLYMTVGISKMIARSSVGTPAEFISVITDSGARCEHANFAESESAVPKSKLDYIQKLEAYRREYVEYLARFGVDVESLDGVVISPFASIASGAKINTGCRIFGKTVIGAGAKIGPYATIVSSNIGENTVVGASTVEDSHLEKDVSVDSYCIVREGSHILSGSKIASSCEIVDCTLLADCHVASHTHLWDSEVGSRAMIGSGVTTINYEVNRKQSKCKIGDDAVIGCGSCLVLPIEIGAGAFVAAGSTITDDVPSGALAIAREYQSNRNGWASRRKNHVKHI